MEVRDNVPGASAVLSSITSNQSVTGDIDEAAFGIYDDSFLLRAQRSGNSIRHYLIAYTAKDLADNTTTVVATVTVPILKPKDADLDPLPIPDVFELTQNYPNPFGLQTIITFSLPYDTYVRLTAHNVIGMPVKTLLSGSLEAGTYTLTWDGRDEHGARLSSGLYLCRFSAGNQVLEKKMLLVH